MRVRKTFCLLFILAMFVATSNSNAAFFAWTGAGDGISWDDDYNWDQLAVPPHDSGDVGLQDQTYGSVIQIDSDVAADCTFGHPDGFGTIFGPEFGMDLDIYGSLTYQWYMAPVQNDELGDRSVINVYDGGSIYGAEGIGLGDNWWFPAPFVTMNMYEGSSVDLNWMWIGGHLNLFGGVLDLEGGVNMDGDNDGDGTPNVPDSLKMINIEAGTLILPADYTAAVNDWMDRGILLAYGGAGTILIDTEVNPGRTTVTAIPEPATIALMCLGGIALIRKKRS